MHPRGRCLGKVWPDLKTLERRISRQASPRSFCREGMSHCRLPQVVEQPPFVSCGPHLECFVKGAVGRPHPQVAVEDNQRLPHRGDDRPRRRPGRRRGQFRPVSARVRSRMILAKPRRCAAPSRNGVITPLDPEAAAVLLDVPAVVVAPARLAAPAASPAPGRRPATSSGVKNRSADWPMTSASV